MLAARHRARLAMQDSNADTPDVCLRHNSRAQNVRRRLFGDEGDSDRQEERGSDDNLRNEFSEEIRRNLEKAKERWNFDFENEEPLAGNYDWVKLDKDGNEIQNFTKTGEIELLKNENNTEESKERETNEAACEKPQGLNQTD